MKINWKIFQQQSVFMMNTNLPTTQISKKKKKKTVLQTEFFKPKYCVDRDSVTACRCHGRPPEFGSPSMLEEGPPAGTSHSVDTGSGKA